MTDRGGFNLSIRAARPDDWEAVYLAREEPGVRYNLLAVPYTNPVTFRERFQSQRDGHYAVVAEAIYPDGRYLIAGEAGLHRNELDQAHKAGLGIHVATAYQGMGVGTALMRGLLDLADNWLNLHRVELEVFSDNERGIALYKKMGFEIEATMRRYAYRDGAYTDACKMGRINPRHAEVAQ